MARARSLLDRVAALGVDDPGECITSGNVEVDGIIVTNPRSSVQSQASVRLRRDAELRGTVKLNFALDAFQIDPAGKIALDVGASTGGFTRTLLQRGAVKVYACDVGHGQLLGSLRQDDRVVNLEGTNVSDLTRDLVPEVLGLISVDVSYLSLRAVSRYVTALRLAPGCVFVGLVKPMFELKLPTAPFTEAAVRAGIDSATLALEENGWEPKEGVISPIPGGGGAREGFVFAIWHG